MQTFAITEEVLDWVDRWTAHGGELGKHDGNGNLLLTGASFEADDPVAQDLAAELRADQSLADGVAGFVVVLLSTPDVGTIK